MTRRERVWTALALAPALLVFAANATFVRNHFYVHGPYLHDSGWFSKIVFRDGLIPLNPPAVARGVPSYFGWHVSPLISLGSLLSYAFPGDRVDWYCLFQGAIYTPLAFAVPMLVPREKRAGIAALAIVIATSLLFSFGGQVLSCVGFPHFEIFSSAGLAIMLAALATGNQRAAWIGLAMSAITREDGGGHAGALLVAVLATDLLGRPFPVPRRRVMLMAGVAFACTAIAVYLQKRLFVGPNSFEVYLVGNPPFAHLSKAVIVERIAFFAAKSGYVWTPLAATLLIAAFRRDARYLLGMAAAIPWFLLNFTAKQELKSTFSVYTGFPFIGSAFWVAAYACVDERRMPRYGWRWPLIALGIVSVAATLGLNLISPVHTLVLFHDLFISDVKNASGMRAFARGLREGRYADVRVDAYAASWAIETVRYDQILIDADVDRRLLAGDGYAFFGGEDAFDLLLHSPFLKCGKVAETTFFFCVKPEATLPPTVIAARPWVDKMTFHEAHVRRQDGGIAIPPTPIAEVRGYGPFVKLRPGTYEITWHIAFDHCDPSLPQPNMRVDVLRGGKTLVRGADVTARDLEGASDPTVTLSFDVTEQTRDELLEFRTFSGTCPFVLRNVDVHGSGSPANP